MCSTLETVIKHRKNVVEFLTLPSVTSYTILFYLISLHWLWVCCCFLFICLIFIYFRPFCLLYPIFGSFNESFCFKILIFYQFISFWIYRRSWIISESDCWMIQVMFHWYIALCTYDVLCCLWRCNVIQIRINEWMYGTRGTSSSKLVIKRHNLYYPRLLAFTWSNSHAVSSRLNCRLLILIKFEVNKQQTSVQDGDSWEFYFKDCETAVKHNRTSVTLTVSLLLMNNLRPKSSTNLSPRPPHKSDTGCYHNNFTITLTKLLFVYLFMYFFHYATGLLSGVSQAQVKQSFNYHF